MKLDKNTNRCTDCLYAVKRGTWLACSFNNELCKKIDECPEGYEVDWDCSEMSIKFIGRRKENVQFVF